MYSIICILSTLLFIYILIFISCFHSCYISISTLHRASGTKTISPRGLIKYSDCDSDSDSSVYMQGHFLSCLILIDCKTSHQLARCVIGSLVRGWSRVRVIYLAPSIFFLTLTWRTKRRPSENLLTVLVWELLCGSDNVFWCKCFNLWFLKLGYIATKQTTNQQ